MTVPVHEAAMLRFSDYAFYYPQASMLEYYRHRVEALKGKKSLGMIWAELERCKLVLEILEKRANSGGGQALEVSGFSEETPCSGGGAIV